MPSMLLLLALPFDTNKPVGSLSSPCMIDVASRPSATKRIGSLPGLRTSKAQTLSSVFNSV